MRDPADADGARIGNFNSSSHNFLRISRIVTSLGELGFRRCKAAPASLQGLTIIAARPHQHRCKASPSSRVDPVVLWHHTYYGTILAMAPYLP